jgi:hypothetical protein
MGILLFSKKSLAHAAKPCPLVHAMNLIGVALDNALDKFGVFCGIACKVVERGGISGTEHLWQFRQETECNWDSWPDLTTGGYVNFFIRITHPMTHISVVQKFGDSLDSLRRRFPNADVEVARRDPQDLT